MLAFILTSVYIECLCGIHNIFMNILCSVDVEVLQQKQVECIEIYCTLNIEVPVPQSQHLNKGATFAAINEINLHWHFIITQSSYFTLGFTLALILLGVENSVYVDKWMIIRGYREASVLWNPMFWLSLPSYPPTSSTPRIHCYDALAFSWNSCSWNCALSIFSV